MAWRQSPGGSEQHLTRAAAAARTRTQRPGKHLAVHASELVVKLDFQILRRYRRPLLLRLEHTHRPTLEDYVHRATRLGSSRSLNLRIGINGYQGLKLEDLPPYRRLRGIPQGYNPVHGWQPIQFPDTKSADSWSQADVGMALGAIEKSVGERSEGSCAFPYSPEDKVAMQRSLNFRVDVCVFVQRSQLWNIVEQVRNLILNWSLELEKAGVLGEDMHFSEQEKGDAEPVTQQFFIQNVGVLGNVTDQASVTNQQTATTKIELELGQVRDFLAQARTVCWPAPGLDDTQ